MFVMTKSLGDKNLALTFHNNCTSFFSLCFNLHVQVNINVRESFTLQCAGAKISNTAGQCALLLNMYRKVTLVAQWQGTMIKAKAFIAIGVWCHCFVFSARFCTCLQMANWHFLSLVGFRPSDLRMSSANKSRFYCLFFIVNCFKTKPTSKQDCQMQRIIFHFFFQHLLKDLDFWDIRDINLQNGHCLEGRLVFCQCQVRVTKLCSRLV